MIKYLIEKEFKQIVRNPFIPKLILLFPCMIMILMPWAANLEIKNIRLNIVDNDCSPLSRKLIQKSRLLLIFVLQLLLLHMMKGYVILNQVMRILFWKFRYTLRKTGCKRKRLNFC